MIPSSSSAALAEAMAAAATLSASSTPSAPHTRFSPATPSGVSTPLRPASSVYGFGGGSTTSSVGGGGMSESPTRELFIFHIPREWPDSELAVLFSPYGTLLSNKIQRWPDGSSRGYGFVTYDNEASALKAIAALDNQMLPSGGRIRVSLKKSKEEAAALKAQKYSGGGLSDRPGLGSVVSPGETTADLNDRTLFVFHVPSEWTDEILREHFGVYGTVMSCHVSKKPDGASRGYAFISYSTAIEAQNAIEGMNGYVAGPNKRLKVSLKSESRGRPDCGVGVSGAPGAYGCTIFISSYPTKWDEEDLRSNFTTFGRITNCFIRRDDSTGDSLGYGFVTFDNPDAALMAIERMNGIMICGKRLRVAIKRGEEAYAMRAYGAEYASMYGGMNPYGPQALYDPSTQQQAASWAAMQQMAAARMFQMAAAATTMGQFQQPTDGMTATSSLAASDAAREGKPEDFTSSAQTDAASSSEYATAWAAAMGLTPSTYLSMMNTSPYSTAGTAPGDPTAAPPAPSTPGVISSSASTTTAAAVAFQQQQQQQMMMMAMMGGMNAAQLQQYYMMQGASAANSAAAAAAAAAVNPQQPVEADPPAAPEASPPPPAVDEENDEDSMMMMVDGEETNASVVPEETDAGDGAKEEEESDRREEKKVNDVVPESEEINRKEEENAEEKGEENVEENAEIPLNE